MLARQLSRQATQASIPARRRMKPSAPALPLILTFSPAAMAAKAKESIRGMRSINPAKSSISAKDGAVKSDHTLQLRRGAGLFSSPCKRSAAGRGKG
jgi:hypothetical protein